jgi:hypothetical protein
MADTRKEKLQMMLEAMQAAKEPMTQDEMLAALNDHYQQMLGTMGQTPNMTTNRPGLLNPAIPRTMEYNSAQPVTPLVADPALRSVPMPPATGPGKTRNLLGVSPLYRMMQ